MQHDYCWYKEGCACVGIIEKKIFCQPLHDKFLTYCTEAITEPPLSLSPVCSMEIIENMFVRLNTKKMDEQYSHQPSQEKQVCPIFLWKFPDSSAALLLHLLPGARAGICI